MDECPYTELTVVLSLECHSRNIIILGSTIVIGMISQKRTISMKCFPLYSIYAVKYAELLDQKLLTLPEHLNSHWFL